MISIHYIMYTVSVYYKIGMLPLSLLNSEGNELSPWC